MTVKDLREHLAACAPDSFITFGNSPYSCRPLVFFRIKQRGQGLYHVELTHMEPQSTEPNKLDAQYEHRQRITVGEFLRQLASLGEACEVAFSQRADLCDLTLDTLVPVVALNLVLAQQADVSVSPVESVSWDLPNHERPDKS